MPASNPATSKPALENQQHTCTQRSPQGAAAHLHQCSAVARCGLASSQRGISLLCLPSCQLLLCRQLLLQLRCLPLQRLHLLAATSTCSCQLSLPLLQLSSELLHIVLRDQGSSISISALA